MGTIGDWISSTIGNYVIGTIEARKANNIESTLYSPSGDDSPPLDDDKVYLSKKDGEGNYVVIGTLSISEGAKAGEKILFSRNSDGEVKSKIYLNAAGEIVLNDGEGFAVAFNDLKVEFNKLNDEYNKLVQRMLAWVPVPNDGGAALKTSITTPPSVAVSGSNIDNTKVEKVRLP